jgi:glycosyltransferase involved in cell wall biosynthesis
MPWCVFEQLSLESSGEFIVSGAIRESVCQLLPRGADGFPGLKKAAFKIALPATASRSEKWLCMRFEESLQVMHNLLQFFENIDGGCPYMKVIIQIPCYNEEATLPATVRDLPASMEGVDAVEYLIVDDGSSDRTVEVARSLGVHHIIRLKNRCGLALAFKAGIEACLERGADIVVNTDGDNQYRGADVPKLIGPILRGEADIVIGERPINDISHFSPLKKFFQKKGSAVVSWLANVQVPDATSGFRAFTREALLKLNLVSDYTYTLESIIYAGRKRIPVTSVKICTNPMTRESRLIKNIMSYMSLSVLTILRVWLNYAALKISLVLAGALIFLGLAIGTRFLYYFITEGGAGHVQSLILMAVLIFTGFQMVLIGFLADLISGNKRLLEDISLRVKLLEQEYKKPGSK